MARLIPGDRWQSGNGAISLRPCLSQPLRGYKHDA
jgi:hypothetical protein